MFFNSPERTTPVSPLTATLGLLLVFLTTGPLLAQAASQNQTVTVNLVEIGWAPIDASTTFSNGQSNQSVQIQEADWSMLTNAVNNNVSAEISATSFEHQSESINRPIKLEITGTNGDWSGSGSDTSSGPSSPATVSVSSNSQAFIQFGGVTIKSSFKHTGDDSYTPPGGGSTKYLAPEGTYETTVELTISP